MFVKYCMNHSVQGDFKETRGPAQSSTLIIPQAIKKTIILFILGPSVIYTLQRCIKAIWLIDMNKITKTEDNDYLLIRIWSFFWHVFAIRVCLKDFKSDFKYISWRTRDLYKTSVVVWLAIIKVIEIESIFRVSFISAIIRLGNYTCCMHHYVCNTKNICMYLFWNSKAKALHDYKRCVQSAEAYARHLSQKSFRESKKYTYFECSKDFLMNKSKTRQNK